MIRADHLRRYTIAPALHQLGLWSQAAENLVLGTCLTESTVAGNTCLMQIGGPARGIYQIEPVTHRDMFKNWLDYRPQIKARVMAVVGNNDNDPLINNLTYATMICRLIYYRRPEPLPGANDVQGLAAYWKQHFNTSEGAGDPRDFIWRYQHYHKS